MFPCQEYGHVYVIVDASGGTDYYRCTDCGDEYED
jgi:hypothetical protein